MLRWVWCECSKCRRLLVIDFNHHFIVEEWCSIHWILTSTWMFESYTEYGVLKNKYTSAQISPCNKKMYRIISLRKHEVASIDATAKLVADSKKCAFNATEVYFSFKS